MQRPSSARVIRLLAIEQALNVTINSYEIAGRAYYSNDRDPSLPARFSDVVMSLT